MYICRSAEKELTNYRLPVKRTRREYENIRYYQQRNRIKASFIILEVKLIKFLPINFLHFNFRYMRMRR